MLLQEILHQNYTNEMEITKGEYDMSVNNNPFYGNSYTWGGNHNNRFQSIPGRLVNNLDEITPQEVPMDGSVSLFPQNDYSAIYAKTWTKDGTIATVKYVPQHSMSYNEYRKAKRHYTETKSPSDKQMMDEKSRRHIHEALDTFKDIWKDADPAMRKELKASMQQAINEMPA